MQGASSSRYVQHMYRQAATPRYSYLDKHFRPFHHINHLHSYPQCHSLSLFASAPPIPSVCSLINERSSRLEHFCEPGHLKRTHRLNARLLSPKTSIRTHTLDFDYLANLIGSLRLQSITVLHQPRERNLQKKRCPNWEAMDTPQP